MQELGFKECPCKVLATDTLIDKLKAYAIKDNVPFGENDWDALANEWEAGELEDWGLDIPGQWHEIEEQQNPELKDGDRSPFQGMTFTLHDEQVETIKAAIGKAKKVGGANSPLNENSNGNALAFIAAEYLNG
jgi:hypothetical protein